MAKKQFLLYKIYYKDYNSNDYIIYLGRTKQTLSSRLRGHFLSTHKFYKTIDLLHVSKIEYAECQSEADMNIYEIYYICKLKPTFNVDDKARDDLTVTLPELNFIEYKNDKLLNKWKDILKNSPSKPVYFSKERGYYTV